VSIDRGSLRAHDQAVGAVGTVRTRPTQSSSTAAAWTRGGRRSNSPCTYSMIPTVPTFKIAEEPVWLRYQWDRIRTIAFGLSAYDGGSLVVRRHLN
jgi:hypothetical protein